MANTTEMLRLMRHAADLLDACDPSANAEEVVRSATIIETQRAATRRAAAEAAAIGTASTVLRMVAAAMEDKPEPVRPAIAAEAHVTDQQ